MYFFQTFVCFLVPETLSSRFWRVKSALLSNFVEESLHCSMNFQGKFALQIHGALRLCSAFYGAMQALPQKFIE